ncbi:MAG: DUF2252 family protein [Vicinamibacterales bacterium]
MRVLLLCAVVISLAVWPRHAGDQAAAWLTAQDAAPLPPALLEALRQDSYTYFRRVNKLWNARACSAFTAEPLLGVRLHGDAHLEQYALTSEAHGLDDFDDSAVGPAVIDLVRFIGSLRLAAERRGWHSRTSAAIEQFMSGYRRALREPAYAAPTPQIVRRLRARVPPSPAAFLASSEARMGPVSPQLAADAREFLPLVAARVAPASDGYFNLKRIGGLQMGVGSYTAAKVLMRVEGPSAASDDDVILEAREVSDLRGAACITTPGDIGAVRVIAGSQQIGRLRHEVLSVIPRLSSSAPTASEWWLRSWDRTYAEVDIADLQSARELEELAHDAGAQLGSASVPVGRFSRTATVRRQQLRAIARLEPRVRTVAAELTREMLTAWKRFRAAFSGEP